MYISFQFVLILLRIFFMILLIVLLFYCWTILLLGFLFFFFFKQKTAYEMRISDWSSDVCSSDLRGERQRLFAAPAEDERIAPLQPQHAPVPAGLADQPSMDVVLSGGRPARALADVDEQRVRTRCGQDIVADQRVVEDDVRRLDRPQRQQRQKPRVARAGADQPDRARQEIGDRKSTRLNSSHQCAPRMPS